jgi:hypothetical protein
MHKKYARDGLAVVSVSVDALVAPMSEELQGRVHEFLQSQGAAFANFLLTEDSDAVTERFHFSALPSLVVYDRDGQPTRFTGAFEHEDVEKLVVRLLQRK